MSEFFRYKTIYNGSRTKIFLYSDLTRQNYSLRKTLSFPLKKTQRSRKSLTNILATSELRITIIELSARHFLTPSSPSGPLPTSQESVYLDILLRGLQSSVLSTRLESSTTCPHQSKLQRQPLIRARSRAKCQCMKCRTRD